MPLQLIHTSAEHLLDRQGSGYGTVARSEALSRILCDKLTALSSYREEAAGAGGAQYSYRVLADRGSAYHVLTRVQMSGADYSGRACHIAHHLILTAGEAEAMSRHPARPTPAGIMLAMEARGLWKTAWCGEPSFLADVPAFCTEDMPDAAAQPTWKRLTGHKGNARAFCTPQYENDCVLLVPQGVCGADILHLLHEGDWLTHLRGWGHTFTTAAAETDSFADTHRMACTAESRRLLERAQDAGHPVLRICETLELPQTPAAPPPCKPQQEPAPAPACAPCRPRTQEAPQPCDRHGTHLRRHRRHIIKAACAGAAALCLAGAVWLLSTQGNPATVTIRVQQQPQGGAANIIGDLAELAEQPFDAARAETTLTSLANQANVCGQTGELSEVTAATLQECCRLLLQADNRAAHLARAIECAELLGVPPASLAQLYMQLSTHGTTPARWLGGMEARERAAWAYFLNGNPVLRDSLLASFSPYLSPFTATAKP